MKTITSLGVACLALLAASSVYARGFGGAGGGRGEAGGYHGGGEAGGYHGGGQAAGYHSESAYHGDASGYHSAGYGESGYHASGAEASGYHADAYHADGYHGGDYAAAGYHGALPTDAGFAHPAAAGAAVGAYAHPMQQFSGSQLAAQGASVRNAYSAVGSGAFSHNWYGAHPGAWTAAGWAAGAAYHPLAWADAGVALGWGAAAAQPVVYDYGNNVTYQGDQVYYGDQPVASTSDYYQQAATIAQAPPPAAPSDAWTPLGVFGLVQKDQDQPQIIIQLAVNQSGQIAGNYQDLLSDTTLPIHGSVDSKTQRAAWTVGDNKKNVAEAGMYGLTQDECTVLIHQGPSHTQQWILVRLKQPSN